ncbi:Plasmid recombination enzyme [Bacillus sp. OV194]|nr:Plasmid recombination enzyme [Bacillus sp. OV194]
MDNLSILDPLGNEQTTVCSCQPARTTRKIQIDAGMLCSFLITLDKPFFDSLTADEEKRFFKESLAFFQDRYGTENIVYATVHKDEKTPPWLSEAAAHID